MSDIASEVIASLKPLIAEQERNRFIAAALQGLLAGVVMRQTGPLTWGEAIDIAVDLGDTLAKKVAP